jgi:TRAP-type transport system small permease protein
MAHLSRATGFIAGLLVSVLVLATAASVVARYVFGAPFQWTEEFSGLLMIWIVFIGAIGCEIRGEHLTIDVVTELLPDRPRRALALVVGIASLGLLAAMAWLGWELSVAALTKQTRLLGISWFWIDLAVVVGAVGIGIVLFTRLLRVVRGRATMEDGHFADYAPIRESSEETIH